MPELSRRHLLASALLLVALPAGAGQPTMTVWRSRGCGCCALWAEHVRAAGLSVVLRDVGDLARLRAAAGVPADLAGCLIEGHVPAAHILRVLAERPAVRGLAVPGMPIGSPGMEVPGTPPEPFAVIAFSSDGSRYVLD
jgi:hypothetical protein